MGVVFSGEARLRVERWMVDHPDGTVSVHLDDAVILERSTRPVLLEDRLYIPSTERWERDRYVQIAEWYVTSLYPLPCPTTVETTVLEAAD